MIPKTEENLKFISRKRALSAEVLNKFPRYTQVLMITGNNNYMLGKIEIDRHTKEKYISNDYYCKWFHFLSKPIIEENSTKE